MQSIQDYSWGCPDLSQAWFGSLLIDPTWGIYHSQTLHGFDSTGTQVKTPKHPSPNPPSRNWIWTAFPFSGSLRIVRKTTHDSGMYSANPRRYNRCIESVSRTAFHGRRGLLKGASNPSHTQWGWLKSRAWIVSVECRKEFEEDKLYIVLCAAWSRNGCQLSVIGFSGP